MRLNPPRKPGFGGDAQSQQLNPPHGQRNRHAGDAPPPPQTNPKQGRDGGDSLDLDFDEPLPGYDRFFAYWDEATQSVRWVEKHRETFTVYLLTDSTGAALVAGQDYLVQIDHSLIGSWGKLTHCRVLADCTNIRIAIGRDCQSTDTVLQLQVSLASNIDAGSYGTAVQLQFTVSLEGFFFTAGAGGSATATAYTFQGLFADFVNIDGDTMTGALAINPTTNNVPLSLKMVSGFSTRLFNITNASNQNLWGIGATSAFEAIPNSSGSAFGDFYGFGTSLNTGIVTRNARGTRGSETAVQTNDNLGRWSVAGHRGSSAYNTDVGVIRFRALEAFAAGAGGCYFTIELAPTGSATAAAACHIRPTYVEAVGHYAAGTDSPAQLTADQNNYALGNGRYQRLSTDASRTITGMVAASSGDERVIVNVGSFDLVLAHDSASSTAANRIYSNTGANLTLNPNESATLFYDGTSNRWRVIATTGA